MPIKSHSLPANGLTALVDLNYIATQVIRLHFIEKYTGRFIANQ